MFDNIQISAWREPTEVYVIAYARGGEDSRLRTSAFADIVSSAGVLPVFTLPEPFYDFVKAYFPEGGPARPVAFALSPLKLANIVSQLQATGGLESLIFDPSAVCDGLWAEPQIPIPARAYLRYISELMDNAGETLAEAKAKLDDHFAGPEGCEKLLVWCASQEKEVIANARARHEEWVIEDDPWGDEPDHTMRW